MKRLFLLFVLSAFTGIILGQSVNELHLKNGSVIKGSILDLDPSGDVKIKTTDAKVYTFSMSEVDHIVQEKSKTTDITLGSNGKRRIIDRHRDNLYWLDTGQTLTSDEYATVLKGNLFDTFYSAQKQFNNGKSLIFAGVAFTLAAVLSYSSYLNSAHTDAVTKKKYYDESKLDIFILTSAGADVCFFLGFMFRGIGKGRMEWVKDTYNMGYTHTSSVSFKPSLLMTAQNDLGLGFSLSYSF